MHTLGLCIGLTGVTLGYLSETLRCAAAQQGAFDLLGKPNIQKTMRNL